MPYRLAIFDFDGTLADSFPWFVQTVNEAADRFGFRRIRPEEVDRLRGYHAREVIRHVGMPMWKAPAVGRFVRGRMARDAAAIPLFAGIGPVLEELRGRGVRLAIVTSNSEGNVRSVLGERHAGLFERLECGASLFGKRRRLRRVLAVSGVRPEEAICIGDELRDLQAARAERIPFGAVAWGYTAPDSLRAHRPEQLFARVEEILERLA